MSWSWADGDGSIQQEQTCKGRGSLEFCLSVGQIRAVWLEQSECWESDTCAGDRKGLQLVGFVGERMDFSQGGVGKPLETVKWGEQYND